MTVQDGAELAGCRQLLLFVFISIFYTSGDSICYQPWQGTISVQHSSRLVSECFLALLLVFEEESQCLPYSGGRILLESSDDTRIRYYLPQRRGLYGTLLLSCSRGSQYFHLYSNLCIHGEPNPGPHDCMDFVSAG